MHKRSLLAALVAAVAVVCPADATLTSTSSSVSYVGNGATTSYTVPFKFLASTDLVVTVGGATKNLNSDYTVTGAGNATGTVKFTVAPASSLAVVVTRTVPLTQTASVRTALPFPAGATIDTALDRATMQLQQVEAARAALAIKEAADVAAAINPTPVTVNSNSLILATGTTKSRTLADITADALNVKGFTGVVGDGANDDTAGIQAAITAAYGRILVFPPGTYKLTAALNISTLVGITLRGKGATLATNQQVAIQFSGDSSNVSFESLRFSTSEVSSSGVLGLITSLNNTLSNIKVIDCEFTGGTSSTDGVKIDQTTVGKTLAGLEISGSRFLNLGMMGVEIINHTFDNLSRYEQVRIVNNRFDGLGKSAIYGQAVSLSGLGKNNVVANNTIQDATDIAIEIVGPWQTLVANNVLRNLASGTTGLYAAKPLSAAAKPNNVSFVGNIVESNNGFAFQPSGINIGTISGNVITGTGKVSIEASDFLSLTGNTFDVTNAVVITGCTYITASGNRFSSHGNVVGNVPSITNTTFSVFSGCTFQSEKTAGVLVNGTSSNNLFSGCLFSNENAVAAGPALQFDASATGNLAIGSIFRRTAAGGNTWQQTAGATGNVVSVQMSNTLNIAAADTPKPTSGLLTLIAGTGTASVSAGSICACSDSTANASVKCTVSGTTLSATGAGADVISFVCF